MVKMAVYVLMEHIGLELGAKHMDVLADNHGMDQSVFVIPATTTMEAYVYFVLTDKNGTQ